MKEESAIDVLFEVRDIVKAQQKQIEMLQASLNTIGAKVNQTLYPDFKGPAGTVNGKPIKELYQEPPQSPKPKKKEKPKAKVPKQRKNIRVFGHFDDDNGKPLSGVIVRIMDANNKVVKQTKSNRAGLWMSFLPPGKYIAEFEMAGMHPEARQFQLLDGHKEVEVS